MDYETLRYERDGHVTVLTYDRPEQRNAISRQMNGELHDAWRRFRDDEDEFVLVITGEGDAFCAGWDLEDAAEWRGRPATGTSSARRLQLARRVRLHAADGRLQAGDRRRQRLGGRRRARERAARRHPDRRRERRLRRARAALEHRRRRRHDRPAPARRRLREGDGADHHRPRRWTRRRRCGSGWRTRSCREGKALERAVELAHEIAELPQGAIRSDKETMVRNVGRTYEEQLRQEAENTMSMFARRDSHAIGASAFKEGRDPGVATPRALAVAGGTHRCAMAGYAGPCAETSDNSITSNRPRARRRSRTRRFSSSAR